MASDFVRISGLWAKESAAGRKFLSGKSNQDVKLPAGTKFFIFENDKRQNDSDPEHTISYVLPEEEGAVEVNQDAGGATPPF